MKQKIFLFALLMYVGLVSATASSDKSRPILYVNDMVTTTLIMSENIKLVDISTEKVVGNQAADNVVRIKPSGACQDQEFLGTITLIGERNICLYDLVYTSQQMQAETLFKIPTRDMTAYLNPSVRMSQKEMATYSWAIFTSARKFNNITSKGYGLKMIVNNIYAVDDYFFIDFSIYNSTNVKYDIDELRVKLRDTKETKATNSQTIELTPEYILNGLKSFKHSYRNVIVLKKLTYPEEKILQLEVYESQISGRTVTIPISYEDILHADALSPELLKHLPNK